MKRRSRRAAAAAVALTVGLAGLGCGKVGPPVRREAAASVPASTSPATPTTSAETPGAENSEEEEP